VLYLIEQSWPEALLLALVAAMVWSVQRDQRLLAVTRASSSASGQDCSMR